MRPSLLAIAVALPLVTVHPPVSAQTGTVGATDVAGWGVLPVLAGQKFVWNAGRARGSHDKELTLHEFQWSGPALLQTQCSYWPQKNMRPVCGTHVIERLPDGILVLKANGGTPVFKGSVAPDGSVEFVNKTWFGKFTTHFVVQADGSVALTHGNWVDGASLAPLIPIDAAREAQIMADLEAVHQSIQAERRAESDRQYNALMGVLGALNTSLATELATARVREAQSRAQFQATLAQPPEVARRQAQPSVDRGRASGAAALSQPPLVQAPPERSGASAPVARNPGAAAPEPAAPVAATKSPDSIASTRARADGCVGPPVTGTHRCNGRSGPTARVVNSCTAPVDVRMCFMTEAGWRCQSRYGLDPAQAWEPGDCAGTGQVFRAVRYSDSREPLAQP